MEKMIIVGGGTAGYVASLIMRQRFPKLNITVIKSDKIGIVGVGEGSTEHWKSFIDFIEVDFKSLIKECDATIKAGLYFKGWSDSDYFHNVEPLGDINIGQEAIGYMSRIVNEPSNKAILNDINILNSKISINSVNQPPVNQFHFNTFKLNKFLEKLCNKRNIHIIIDEIEEVEVNENGISRLRSKNSSYTADFYIDSTGFRRKLITKLGAKWNSYSDYLKMKAAIAFPTEDTEEYPTYTTCKAMDYGWMWRIPTYGRYGNGYIFDSDYIDETQAQLEVEKTLGRKIEVGKFIKFDPGKLDKVWIKNCVAIGLSASFVEPLEATSIGTTIQQLFLLMNYLGNHSKDDIIEYNQNFEEIMQNIVDFICLHYITNKNDTEFWRDLQKLKVPPSLSKKLKQWNHRLPINEDFKGSRYLLFNRNNFIQVLHGLNLINYDNIRKRWDLFNEEYKSQTYNMVNNVVNLQNEDVHNYLGHKQYLTLIRESKYNVLV